MCGVVGYFSLKPKESDKIKIWRLINNSKIRGLHSYGFGFMTKGGPQFEKFHDLEECSLAIENNIESNMIFHNRYSTSGDYRNHVNNQPVVLYDKLLVFNGVISQATREENAKKYGLELYTDNDGEILLHQENKEEFIKKMKGSFAGLWIEDGKMYAMRNERRPLYYCVSGKSVFVASTKDIFRRSGFNEENVKEFKANKLYQVIDLCHE